MALINSWRILNRWWDGNGLLDVTSMTARAPLAAIVTGMRTLAAAASVSIVNSHRFTDIPLILETPLDEEQGNKGYLEEIELLQSLIDS